MLASIVAELSLPTTAALPATHGEAMHQELFRQLNLLDRLGATEVHGPDDSRVRPYTISNISSARLCFENGQLQLQPSEAAWFRITGLHADATQLLLALSECSQTWQLSGRNFQTRFHIRRWAVFAGQHPWSGLITPTDLGQAAWQAYEQDPHHIKLRFQSPTTFERDSDSNWGNWMPLPLPELVFGSLRKRVAQFCPALGTPPPRGTLVEGHVALGRYKLETHMLHFQKHNRRRTGFVGECEFLLDPSLSLPEKLWLHLLACFAFYSGVGAGTSWGMGQVRREPAGDFCYRGVNSPLQ